MKALGVHDSEWKWVGVGNQTVIDNDGDLNHLKNATNLFLGHLQPM
jgi:hypothetical protein